MLYLSCPKGTERWRAQSNRAFIRNGGSMKCWICGSEAEITRPYFNRYGCFTRDTSKYHRCYCKDCMVRVEQSEAEEKALYIKLKKREMVKKAINLLESQHTDMYEYKEAITVVENFVENNIDKIDSSYEALTAIILVQNRIHSKMQYKVGQYQVDFLLPDLLIALEIDGERHKYRKGHDSKRDSEIKQILGPHWEIVRIKTEYLDQNAKKLPEAINQVIEYRESGHINWRNIQ
jgi:very-short-patch-repair endonuclease